uniref:Sin3A-associated protein b n=1 Tax=Scleropages formosus TaxID=113540 RepID=A0A8C9VJX6_SCLFO
MSSQQFPRTGVPPPGLGQAQVPGPSGTMGAGSQKANESCRDPDHNSRDHPPGSGGGSGSGGGLPFRDEKQETVVVRPYPQVQAHSQPLTMAQHLPIQAGTPVTVSATPTHLPQGLPLAFAEGPMKSTLKTSMPSRLIAPAPASNQGHLTKVPGHVTVTMENSMPQSSAIPVATISGQQGHSSNLHHLMAANVQIIRSSTPALQIGSSAPPPHTFTSHLPRGAAAAAVMSSTKGPTVLRPASGPSAGAGQPTVQHIIHQPIQSRPVVTTSTAVLPTVVAPVSATRAQSPVITTTATHPAEILRPGLTIHPPPPATISIQRPPSSRDTATRITLPSHPAIGTPKPQAPHTMTQKSIFSTVTPVAAATVAPILATNTVPSPTTTGSVSHTQMTTSNIVTMTMASHSSHATAVTTSTIPVAKVVPQPIAHTSPRIQPEYPGERGNLIPISGHRSSPNPVTMEARSDNRQPVPVQFQYFLPTYPSSPYPLTHTYTPITSTVSTIRQYPVTPQAPSSAMPSQAGVGVASAVHLNSMQLMTVDRITQISTQGIQPAAMAAQSIQSGPVGTQGLHTSAPIGAQSIQPAPLSAQQPQAEAKASVVLADGSTLVANPIGSTFGAAPPVTTATGTHPQGSSSSAPTLVSSPRPSILRKKPASESSAVRKNLIPAQPSEATSPRLDGTIRSASGSPRPAGVKTKSDIHVAIAPPVPAPMEALPSQISEQSQQQQATPSPAQHPSQAVPTLLAATGPPSQSAAALSAIPAAVTVAPPIPASMANVVAPPTQPAASSTAACAVSATLPEIKMIKQEVEPMDTLQDVVILLSTVSSMTPGASAMLAPLGNALGVPGADVIPGASPRKKPRKQQHVISTEESEMVETNSTDEEKAVPRPPSIRPEKRKSPPKEYIDEEGVRYVPVRIRPPVTLLRHYRNPWKAAYHHFQRYSDIRVKEEKKGTLQDVANQKGVVCRAQGWKVHLCAAQLLQLTSLERDVYSRLTTLQEGLIPKKKAGADDELHRINELIQGNMQRCKLVMDQITEARDAMMKVLDHKDRVLKLLNKNGGAKKVSKLKRKEKA